MTITDARSPKKGLITFQAAGLRKADDLPDLLTRAEAAEFYGLAKQTLARWAVEGTGPRVTRIGSAVRYRKADVLAFVEAGAA